MKESFRKKFGGAAGKARDKVQDGAKTAADAARKAADSRSLRRILTSPSALTGVFASAASAAYTARKLGPGAAVVAGAGSMIWALTSAVYFETLRREEEEDARNKNGKDGEKPEDGPGAPPAP